MSIDTNRNQLDSSEITQKLLQKKRKREVENIDRSCIRSSVNSKLNRFPRVITRRKDFRLTRINGMTRRNAAVLCNLARITIHGAIRVPLTFHRRAVRCIRRAGIDTYFAKYHPPWIRGLARRSGFANPGLEARCPFLNCALTCGADRDGEKI